MNDEIIESRLGALEAESDADRQIAMTRRLRAEIWDMLSDADLARIEDAGLDVTQFRGALRLID